MHNMEMRIDLALLQQRGTVPATVTWGLGLNLVQETREEIPSQCHGAETQSCPQSLSPQPLSCCLPPQSSSSHLAFLHCISGTSYSISGHCFPLSPPPFPIPELQQV